MAADKLTLERIELLHPADRKLVKDVYMDVVVPALSGKATCRFTRTLSTFAEQDALFDIGRKILKDAHGKKLSIVTNAKGGQSFHNYAFAWDIVLIVDSKIASWDYKTDFDGDLIPDWMECVKAFKSIGAEWGGDWKGSLMDRPHFQISHGYTWKQLLEKYNAGDFIPGTKYVNI